jgi:hypothetical protein
MSALPEPSCCPCILTAIAPGRTADVQAGLSALRPDEGSPLAGVPGTHFARFVVLEGLVHTDGGTSDHLLFTAEADGTLEGWLAALVQHVGPAGREIWQHCAGFPEDGDQAEVIAWLLRHHHKPGFGLSAIAGVRVGKIRAALRERERIAAFALRTQGLSPPDLKAAWTEEFASR